MTTTSTSSSTTSSASAAATTTGRTPRRRRAHLVTSSLVAGAVIAGVTGLGAAPVQAAEPHGDRIQFCDATACLHAWAVFDSDGDGVSDADEWVAGTDPHDASSRPRMSVLADLLAERQLPSFENGLATMVVMPAELVELRTKAVGAGRIEDLAFDGFPISDRMDAVSRLGITAGSMKELGVDPARSGFTLGLEHPSKDEGGLPPIRIGGVDPATISAGHSDDEAHDHEPPKDEPAATDHGDGLEPLEPLRDLPFGGEVSRTKTSEGGVVVEFKDGTTIVSNPTRGATFNPDGSLQVDWTVTYDKKKKYVNPDAEDATTVDPAAFEAWERTVFAASRAVEGWRAPGTDGDLPTPKGTFIAWVDSDLAIGAFVAFDEPRVTSAQPEMRPDLPNPMAGAPKGGVKGAPAGCTDGYCAG